MNDTIVVAAISAGGSVAVAVTALILNARMFTVMDARFNSLERRLEVIESDLKNFFKLMAEHDKRISKLEDK